MLTKITCPGRTSYINPQDIQGIEIEKVHVMTMRQLLRHEDSGYFVRITFNNEVEIQTIVKPFETFEQAEKFADNLAGLKDIRSYIPEPLKNEHIVNQ